MDETKGGKAKNKHFVYGTAKDWQSVKRTERCGFVSGNVFRAQKNRRLFIFTLRLHTV